MPDTIHTNWIVITGAPCAGKTAVIDKLDRSGYRIVPEVARAYIDEQIAHGQTLSQIKSEPLSFERGILYRKIEIEKKLPQNDLIFLDRAIPDSIAYYQIEGLTPGEAIEQSRFFRYKKIFLFERLTLEKDGVRSETDLLAGRIEALLLASYSELGYHVIRVPVMGIAERTEFILTQLAG